MNILVRSTFLFLTALLFLLSDAVRAQSDETKACYEAKDKECLEAIYKDIVDNPAPEKLDAMYFLGLLYLDEKNYEAAKTQFELGATFGDNDRSSKKLAELIASGNVEVTTTDCMIIGSEECFLNVAANNPEEADKAYYLLSAILNESDAERSAEFAIKAAELGHRTAECLLGFGYGHEKASGPSVTVGFVPQLPKDYEQARYWRTKCGIGPFHGYDEKHFAKYKKGKSHNAYAVMGKKYYVFSTDAATPEIAASIAGALCHLGSKRKADDEECLIVSVDGEWVEYFVAPPLPERVGSAEDLLQLSARQDFNNKYEKETSAKVFVQGPLGNWSWRSQRSSDIPIEELTKTAINHCQGGWLYKQLGSACEVINLNGDWVN